jgi:hypothetical protein
MIKVFVYVEGQTEESFVNLILRPYFSQKDIYLTPIIATTKRIMSGGKFRGGITSYEKVKKDILGLLKDKSAHLVTTMIDYYGLPNDFPGIERSAKQDVKSRLHYLEKSFENDIDSTRFKAYFVKHEFEGLLFSKPEEIAIKLVKRSKAKDLQEIRNSFLTPEDINNNPNTAPSKRILQILPDYDKVSDGPIIADRIGLDTIRSQCKHFHDWMQSIEERFRPNENAENLSK